MAKQTNLNTDEKRALLQRYLTKRVSLSCQVGVCIWGEMFTLQPGRGFCEFDCCRDGMRIGISAQIVYSLEEKLDGTLAIAIQ